MSVFNRKQSVIWGLWSEFVLSALFPQKGYFSDDLVLYKIFGQQLLHWTQTTSWKGLFFTSPKRLRARVRLWPLLRIDCFSIERPYSYANPFNLQFYPISFWKKSWLCRSISPMLSKRRLRWSQKKPTKINFSNI